MSFVLKNKKKYFFLIGPIVLLIFASTLIYLFVGRKTAVRGITVSTDKRIYKRGETVVIGVRNNSVIPIYYAQNIYCGMSFYILTDCSGKEIQYYLPCSWATPQHNFTILPKFITLKGTWNEQVLDSDYKMKEAPPGCYKIQFLYSPTNNRKLGTWGSDKKAVFSEEFLIE